MGSTYTFIWLNKTFRYDTHAYESKRRVGFADDPGNHLVLYPGAALTLALTRIRLRFMND
jgi:hypothetical protein